jgi:two-component system, OmpR family, phosphate regulon sensor histidine kinase PhoR
MIKQTKWYIHPILIFTLSTITLGISLFLYIYWYVTVSESLKTIIEHYQLDPNQFFEAQTWVVILVLSILVVIILTGILIIFNYNLKTFQLYRLQHSFINNFTHELKTPVTSLKIFLETFARHEIPREEQLKYIEYMLQDVERLSHNINSILNVARMESKMYEGEFTPVHIVKFIRSFLDGDTHFFRDSEIRVEDTNGREYIIALNVPLFEILLMNLFTNAVKYNDSERPRIDVSFGLQDKMLQIRFRDNGIGIARNERKKIFRKFYQGSHKEDRVIVRGSGIGLYMVQQITKLHKGKIAADSEGVGKGSVFTLSLPIQEQLREQP